MSTGKISPLYLICFEAPGLESHVLVLGSEELESKAGKICVHHESQRGLCVHLHLLFPLTLTAACCCGQGQLNVRF